MQTEGPAPVEYPLEKRESGHEARRSRKLRGLFDIRAEGAQPRIR